MSARLFAALDLPAGVRDQLAAFSVVAEERHEFGGDVEASLHQVVIEIARERAGTEPDALGERIVATADVWAATCIAARHTQL